MGQTPHPDPVAGPPQTGPAPSTTHWGKAPPAPEVTQFLQGPQKRSFELARAVRIFFEILHGFKRVEDLRRETESSVNRLRSFLGPVVRGIFSDTVNTASAGQAACRKERGPCDSHSASMLYIPAPNATTYSMPAIMDKWPKKNDASAKKRLLPSSSQAVPPCVPRTKRCKSMVVGVT